MVVTAASREAPSARRSLTALWSRCARREQLRRSGARRACSGIRRSGRCASSSGRSASAAEKGSAPPTARSGRGSRPRRAGPSRARPAPAAAVLGAHRAGAFSCRLKAAECTTCVRRHRIRHPHFRCAPTRPQNRSRPGFPLRYCSVVTGGSSSSRASFAKSPAGFSER